MVGQPSGGRGHPGKHAPNNGRSDSGTNNVAGLTSAGRLARNTVWNGLAFGSPVLAAIIAVPFVVDAFGLPKFGVITLAWALIGGFSIFDLGFGWAMTRETATILGRRREAELGPVVWPYLALMAAIGCTGAVGVFAIAHPMAYDILNLPAAIRAQTASMFSVLAIALPAVMLTTGLRGVLEAHQRFALTTAVRVPMNVFTVVAPLVIAIFTRDLVVVGVALAVGRISAAVVYLAICLHVVPALRRGIRFPLDKLWKTARTTGWMTATALATPVLYYADRLLVGGFLSATAIALYATPQEIITKLALVPLAPTGVLFPAFATTFVADRERTMKLFTWATKYLFLAMLPLSLTIITFSDELLRVLLGPGITDQSIRVLQWLAIGMLLQAPTQVAFPLLLGTGRAASAAMLFIIELPLYVGGLTVAIKIGGIEGAAVAWTIRSGVDMVVLSLLASRQVGVGWATIARAVAVMSGGIALCATLALVPGGVPVRVLALALVLVGVAYVGWSRLLDYDERRRVRRPRTAFQV